jgi:hypothetical protein
MGWAAAIGGIATLGSALLGKKASDKATSAQVNAQQQALDLQQQMYQQQQQNLQPYMGYGQGAGGLGGLSALMGGDYSGFMNSPDYMAARDAMQYAGDHGAAARGRVFSGGFAKDMAEAQGNLASQYLGNYRNALMWGANLGQNAAAGVGQAGQQYANSASNAYGNIGNAQASGALTNANIYGQALGGLAGLLGANSNKTASSYNGPQVDYSNWNL